MKHATRPRNHDERDTCIAAVDVPTGSPIDPLLERVLAVWTAARDAYLAARAAHAVALADAASTAAAAREADDAFDVAVRGWARSVIDARRLPRTREISAMLGGLTPGQLVRRPHREEVTRARHMLRQIAVRPELAGDADDLAALVAAIDRLEERVDAAEAAIRARVAAVADLDRANDAFDTSWSQLVRVLQIVDPEGARLVVPRFRHGRARSAAQPAPDAAAPACPPELAVIDGDAPSADGTAAA